MSIKGDIGFQSHCYSHRYCHFCIHWNRCVILRFLQLRKRHVSQQINYLDNEFPRIKECILRYTASEKEKSKQKVDALYEKTFQETSNGGKSTDDHDYNHNPII